MHSPGFTIEIWAAGPKAAFSDLIRMLAQELDADRAGLIDNIVGRGYRSALRTGAVSVDQFIIQRRHAVSATDPVEYLYMGGEHYIFFGAFIREPPAPINGYI